MQQQNIFSALWKAFYSQSLYQDVRKSWRYNILGYLFLVITICTLITAAHDIFHAKRFYHKVVVPVIEQIPTGKLVDGKMTIDKPSPYTIYTIDTKTNKQVALAVFDMNNQVSPEKTDAVFIFRSNTYLINDNQVDNHKEDGAKDAVKSKQVAKAVEWKPYHLKETHEFSAQGAQYIIDKLWVYAPIILTLFGIIFGIIFRLLQGLLYALIVLIFGAIYREALSYAEAYRLAVVAVGPSIFITTALVVAAPHLFHHHWMLAFVIQVIYLFFAAYSNRASTSSES